MAALVNYNQRFSHFSYYWEPSSQPVDAVGHSNSGSETLADPIAWYYFHTGLEPYREIVVEFQETGVPGFNGTAVVPGIKPYYDLRQTWKGDYVCMFICVCMYVDRLAYCSFLILDTLVWEIGQGVVQCYLHAS